LGPRKTTTRERLITTAAELFRRQGYAQTGVNQIIKRADATSGSFYHFFPAKEDLLVAVVDHMAEFFEAEIFGPAGERSADPIDEILTILDLYRRQLVDSGFGFASPMAALSAEVSENHPHVRDRLAEIFAEWTDRIEELLRKADDHLPSDTDRGTLAQLIVCTVEGAVLGTRLHRSPAPFDAAVTELRTYFGLLGGRIERPDVVPATKRAAPVSQAQSADWRTW
jgi:AcrR family transcriptional regulator